MRGEILRALYLDIGDIIAFIYNDYTYSEQGLYRSKNDEDKKRFLIKLILRLKVNYVVYERREVELVPEREGVNRLLEVVELKK
jgi:hypothetical protein